MADIRLIPLDHVTYVSAITNQLLFRPNYLTALVYTKVGITLYTHIELSKAWFWRMVAMTLLSQLGVRRFYNYLIFLL